MTLNITRVGIYIYIYHTKIRVTYFLIRFSPRSNDVLSLQTAEFVILYTPSKFEIPCSWDTDVVAAVIYALCIYIYRNYHSARRNEKYICLFGTEE